MILKEFVLATNMTSCGSVEDKMRWAFKIYDVDQSGQTHISSTLFINGHIFPFFLYLFVGSIDIDELIEIIVQFYDMEDIPRERSVDHAQRIFEAFDADGNGTLDEEEFVQGCLIDPDFSRVISKSIEKLKHR